jgi:Fic family protein
LKKLDDEEKRQFYVKKYLPFSSRLIRKSHKTLLQGVRGKQKLPGEFRKSQNWIGGASIKDATFVPPAHTSINDFMGDLENFVPERSRA